MDQLEATIRGRLESYLAGEASLDEFTDWFVRASWNIRATDDPAAAELVYSIELALAEHSGGILTDDEFRGELANLDRQSRPNLSAIRPS